MKKQMMNFVYSAVMIVFACLTATGHSQAQITIEEAFPNLRFTRPVDLQHANDQSGRLFVVEQRGVITLFENDKNVTTSTEFLNIEDRVNDNGNEEGLLGLAFHPDYAANGYFYVDYTASDPRRTVIARYEVSPSSPDSALKNSELVLLEISQPFSNHNGGQIAFGADGYLYIAMGDGGSGGDPQGNGQNLQTLLGAILRIDVDSPDQGLNYGIPQDNPFAGNTDGFGEEIYAYGLRNPWRFSFDPVTQKLWLADVGQNMYEEVNMIEKGKNYGWNIMEAFHCYNSSSCDTTGLTPPIWEYDRDDGFSVTGGYVYRGDQITELQGKYVYADYVSGRIWSLQYTENDGAVNNLIMDTNLSIASFGTDSQNELYICAFDSKIYRFTLATGVSTGQPLNPANFHVTYNYPNPFNSQTVIRYYLPDNSDVTLKIFNILGQHVKTLVNQYQSKGFQTVVWQGKNQQNEPVAGGVYIFQVQGPGFNTYSKMLYLP